MQQVTVSAFGAAGDGVHDDTKALQTALDSGAAEVVIPAGDYLVSKMLLVHSDTHIRANQAARIIQSGEVPKQRGDFLIQNADLEQGNRNIRITGGIWDGNNTGTHNVKCPDLFDPNGYSGATMNFVNVTNLELCDFEIANSVAFHVRMSRLWNFVIRDLRFTGEKRGPNQDGLHFGGCVYNGVVERIHALTPGQTNDDLIALNADDCVTRVDNFDLERGPIENLIIRDIYAEDCHTLVRMLSVDAPIRNIRIEQVRGGFRAYAINLDAARYCRTPLFNDAERPEGVGVLENILIDGVDVHRTRDGKDVAYIVCESRAKNFTVRNFKRNTAKEQDATSPTLRIVNVANMQVKAALAGGKTQETLVKEKNERFDLHGDIDTLELNNCYACI